MAMPAYEKGSIALDDGAVQPYVKIGDGPIPMVVIPGGGDGLRTAADVAVYLAWFYRQRSSQFRHLVLSRRLPIPPDYAVGQHARDMIRSVEQLQWGPAFWECLSAGGPIGQCVAADRPDLVRGLILSSSLHHAVGQTRTTLENWLRMADEPGGAQLLFSFLEQKYRPPADALSPAQRAESENAQTPDYPGRLRNLLEVLLDLDQRDVLPRVTCPALVVSGQNDRFVPVALQRDMADRIANSRHEICPGFGHFHDVENPAYHGLVSGFVETVITHSR